MHVRRLRALTRLAALNTSGCNTIRSDRGIERIVSELVDIYTKVGRLEAMKGEEGVRSRLATYYKPGAVDRVVKAEAFLDLAKRRFRAKLSEEL